MSELMKLIEQEIPEGRRNLQENFNNLETVAQYCQENYVQNPDKKKALEETKNFTTHSLASVAYQINNLATNFLKLLDLQQNQLAEMESNVNHLAQTVQIHKEKVARREIGVLTTNKSTTRPLGVKNGIIFPEHAERPTKYQRKPIDYSALDDIGHGVKLPDTHGIMRTQSSVSSNTQKTTRSSSISSNNTTPAPNTRPPTPPQNKVPNNNNTGSLSRATGQYRTPAPAVAPPTVPSHYASMQQMQQQQQQQGRSSYAPGHQMNMTQPPVGMARPISQSSVGPPPPASPGLPPMPGGTRISQFPRQQSMDNLPPPPGTPEHLQNASFDFEGGMPLPPPPADQFVFNNPMGPSVNHPPAPPVQYNDEIAGLPPQEEDPYAATGPELMSNNWVPAEYLEKVIAIYDYNADKPDELTFSENSVIYVLKKNDDGWWEGVLNGQTGLFPGNYVEGCL